MTEKEKTFMARVTPFMPIYKKEMLREFFDYWTEISDGGIKMRFEKEKTFQVSKRLARWLKNNQTSFGKAKTKQLLTVDMSGVESLKLKYANE